LARIVIDPKRVALAALLAAASFAFMLTQPQIAPAGGAPLTVNSTANSSDSSCDSSNCTLREAIEAVNDGVTNLIEFDPSVFPPATPGVIDIEGGDGPLPAIAADATIDLSDAAVTIDGDSNDDGTAVGPGLTVNGANAGFTFELFGEGHFTIQQVSGPGIEVDGQAFAADELLFDSINIADTTEDGIYIHNLPYSSDVSLTDSDISSGNNGIRAVMAGPNIQDVGFFVTGSDIVAANADGAGGAAVAFNMQTALATDAAVDFIVEDNTRIRSHGDNGINVVYCSSGTPCIMDHSQINASISGNHLIRSSGDGIHMRLNANPDDPGSSVGSSISVQMDNNDELDADSDGIDISSQLCCGSNNRQTFTVDGNGPLSTVPDGKDMVDIEAGTCCSPGSGSTFDVSDNTGGISAANGEGVQIRTTCCGNNSIDIHDNVGAITSTTSRSIKILNCVKDEADPQPDEADCLGDTTTVLSVTGNTLSGSLEDGIFVCCGEFQRGAERSVIADNTVSNNGLNGMRINSSHGITIGPDNVITGNGATPLEPNNAIEITNNAAAVIRSRYLVDVPADGNTITHNEIHGNTGLGIDLVGFNPTGNPAAPVPDDFETTVVGCHQFPGAPISSNDCLGSPVLTGVISDSLHGEACVGCQVEVFLADDQPPDQPPPPPPLPPAGATPPTQHGEGAAYLATATATNDGSFSVDLPCGLSAGLLTATATDENGNTSEFSANVAFTGTSAEGCPATATPTPGGPSPTPSQTPPATTPPTSTPPGATMTPTSTIEPLLCGDVDGNLSVNSIDAAILLQYTAGLIQTLTVPQSADVNNDGNINSIDAALILQNTAGLLANLHC
jgi:CSLREA domain-containing protein